MDANPFGHCRRIREVATERVEVEAAFVDIGVMAVETMILEEGFEGGEVERWRRRVEIRRQGGEAGPSQEVESKSMHRQGD